MADSLIRGLRTEDKGLRAGAVAPRLIISVFCLLSSVLCCAEELSDPTRPPAMIYAPDGAPGQGIAENRWSSGLQTIIISESRRAAIIDGKTVELGAKHGNARLIEVNEGSVMLQGAQGRRVLTLFPDVKISRRGSSNKELQVKQPASASEVQSGEHITRPSAREEKK